VVCWTAQWPYFDFSKQALQVAWKRHGYNTVSLSDNNHFVFRTLPSYGIGLIK